MAKVTVLKLLSCNTQERQRVSLPVLVRVGYFPALVDVGDVFALSHCQISAMMGQNKTGIFASPKMSRNQ